MLFDGNRNGSGRWVFVQPPKCATTFGHRVLEMNRLGKPLNPGFPSNQWKHLGVADMPPKILEGRTVIVPHRNPWDWWVSWFHFTRGHTSSAEPRSFHKQFARGTDGSFKAVLRRGLYPEIGDDDLLDRLDQWPYQQAEPMPIHAIRARLGIGLFSFQFLRLTLSDLSTFALLDRAELDEQYDSISRTDIVFDCEQIRTALPDALEAAGATITERHRESFANTVRINAAKTDPGRSSRQRPSGPPSRHYDEESLGWVADRESFLVERYGYTGPSS